MKPDVSVANRLSVAVAFAALLCLPAFAAGQRVQDSGAAPSEGSGGGQAVSRGGGSSGGQSTTRGDSGGGSGGGQSTTRGDSGGGSRPTTRGDAGSSAGSGTSNDGGQRTRSGGGQSTTRGDSGGSQPMTQGDAGSSAGSGASNDGGQRIRSGGSRRGDGQTTSRPRDGRPPVGQAVPRPPEPPSSGGGAIFVPGGYYGAGSYYGGYYPWGYGGLGLGGYYGGYYDPWWYGGGYYPQYYSSGYEGALRLKVKPRDASVFVDGYYAGQVDEFDGVFQRLRIEPGPHRIEVRADGLEPLVFEVRILPGRTVTYTGELRPLP